MLKFYYTKLSVNARRIWVSLLEKNLEFEPILLKLNGDQFQPEFTKINPFHHIPVLVDDDFTVIESLAILDYLEAKYPDPSFLPSAEPKSIAKMRSLELVTVNELPPASIVIMREMLELPVENKKLEIAKKQIGAVLQYFEDNLAENSPYFFGERLTLADIVAGTAVPSIPFLGISFDGYPKVKQWCEGLQKRASWQQTEPTEEELMRSKAILKAILERK
ncbi:MAG: glutathione S-transferase family protein [Prochloraceae cyanobacterium]|nr:glutathione S-transferase family protein [Prochloraceae cyanobacterium]